MTTVGLAGNIWTNDVADARGTAGLLVAALDASDSSKRRADYLCDGTADEVEINAAIAALPSGGGCVRLSEGTFNLSDAITDQSKNDVNLSGQGFSTIIGVGNSADADAINLSNVNRWQIRDLKIDGNKANQTADSGDGIHLQVADYCRIENVWIYDVSSRGIRIVSSSQNIVSGCIIDDSYEMGIDIRNTGCVENVVENCWVGNNDNDATVRVYVGCRRNVVRSCIIYNPPAGGIGIQLLGSSGASQIIGCIIRGNIIDGNQTTGGSRTTEGISITGGTDALNNIISDNHIVNCDYGIYDIGVGTTIRGNTARDCDDGCRLQGSSTVCQGNVFEVNYEYGLDLNGCDDVTIVGNILRNNSQVGAATFYGARFRTGTTAIIFSGNQVHDDQGVTTQTHSLDIDATASDVWIIGNRLEGTLINAGTNIALRHNQGFITQNSGACTIADSNTTVGVNHGLDVTPATNDIFLTMSGSGSNDPGNLWTSGIDAASFQANCRADPGSDGLDFVWQATAL